MYEKLADIFNAVAVKYLKAVDVKRTNSKSKGSNQNEIGGLVKAGFSDFLGLPPDGKVDYLKATMVYIADDEEAPIICEDVVSWYDTRFEDPTRSPEYRLYYKTNEVTELFSEGDFFLIALTKDNTLLMAFTPKGSAAESQLRLLFGASGLSTDTKLKSIAFADNKFVLPIRTMLAQIGIELFTTRSDDENKLHLILDKFGAVFPKTREFSSFARGLLRDSTDSVHDPDGTLMSWLDEEEHLFKLLERHIVAEKLKMGFGEHGDDVDEFVKFSLSVQNRRKSRAGHAFENHIEQILLENDLRFDRGAKTEGKQTPDFLFPSGECYKDSNFQCSKLRMLGAKTSCKERWRQVLAEASRISRKHLITIEPAISEDQTNQMRIMNVQLVVPRVIQATYSPMQITGLMTLNDFLLEIKGIEKA